MNESPSLTYGVLNGAFGVTHDIIHRAHGRTPVAMNGITLPALSSTHGFTYNKCKFWFHSWNVNRATCFHPLFNKCNT